jgi:hypothetical protein
LDFDAPILGIAELTASHHRTAHGKRFDDVARTNDERTVRSVKCDGACYVANATADGE